MGKIGLRLLAAFCTWGSRAPGGQTAPSPCCSLTRVSNARGTVPGGLRLFAPAVLRAEDGDRKHHKGAKQPQYLVIMILPSFVVVANWAWVEHKHRAVMVSTIVRSIFMILILAVSYGASSGVWHLASHRVRADGGRAWSPPRGEPWPFAARSQASLLGGLIVAIAPRRMEARPFFIAPLPSAPSARSRVAGVRRWLRGWGVDRGRPRGVGGPRCRWQRRWDGPRCATRIRPRFCSWRGR